LSETGSFEVIEEAVVYPSIPVYKNALVLLIYIVDTTKGMYKVVFGNLTSTLEPALRRARRLRLANVIASSRYISQIVDYESLVPYDPLVSTENSIDLANFEGYVKQALRALDVTQTVTLLTIRGLLIQRFLMNASRILTGVFKTSLSAPVVARLGDVYAASPTVLGIMRDLRLYTGDVPVVTGRPAVSLSDEELSVLILMGAEHLPQAMRIVGRTMNILMKAIEKARVDSLLARLSAEEALEILGRGLVKAAEKARSEAQAAVAESMKTEARGGEVKVDKETAEKVAGEILEAIDLVSGD